MIFYQLFKRRLYFLAVRARIWWGLVVGANLGGNLTPIGSPSNILVLGLSEQEGHPIPIVKFFKICLGVTLMHLIVSMLYLYLMYGLS